MFGLVNTYDMMSPIIVMMALGEEHQMDENGGH